MKEIVLPICVLVVLATLLLPIPGEVLDFLLSANILLALVLLVSTLYINNPLKLSFLPSILLLATIYRLALNISTTRIILSGHDPGQLVKAFGEVVVQGNLIVGVVVFLIITLVQFIVIAKGSERVAEVSARFTLDALPGKQMSIDADVRSGLISPEEAKIKRNNLQLESRFYGALDGAMKFVKGDAIAGLIITAINLSFGIVLGVITLELSIVESIQRFSLYTIGDGLISQIPALLNSLSAGIMVTYVGQTGAETSLAKSLLSQLGQIKVVKGLVAILSIVLALTPGLPFMPFLVLGIALGINALLSVNSKDSELNSELNQAQFKPAPFATIRIEVSKALLTELGHYTEFVKLIENLRQQVFDTWGLILLSPQVEHVTDPSFAFSIYIQGICVSSKKISNDNSSKELEAFKTAFVGAINENKLDLINDTMTRRIVDACEEHMPELIANLVPEQISITTITEILQALLSENISIKPFEQIAQALAEQAKKQFNARELLEHVRIKLSRHICQQMNMFEQEIPLYCISELIETILFKAEKQKMELPDSFLKSLNTAVEKIPTSSVLLATRGTRALLRDCLTDTKYRFRFLAWEELCKSARWKIVDTISDSFESGAKQEDIIEYLAA